MKNCLNWRTSTYSGSEGNCVETANGDGHVYVRDTKDRTGPMLRFDLAAWRAFVARAHDGELDQ